MGGICDQKGSVNHRLPIEVRERDLGGRRDIQEARHIGLEEAEARIEEEGCSGVETGKGRKVDENVDLEIGDRTFDRLSLVLGA